MNAHPYHDDPQNRRLHTDQLVKDWDILQIGKVSQGSVSSTRRAAGAWRPLGQKTTDALPTQDCCVCTLPETQRRRRFQCTEDLWNCRTFVVACLYSHAIASCGVAKNIDTRWSREPVDFKWRHARRGHSDSDRRSVPSVARALDAHECFRFGLQRDTTHLTWNPTERGIKGHGTCCRALGEKVNARKGEETSRRNRRKNRKSERDKKRSKREGQRERRRESDG